MEGIDNNTHERTTHHLEERCCPGWACCCLTRGRWGGWRRSVVCGRQHICRRNKPEHGRCTHRIPGVLLCPPAYVCRLLGRCLHIRYSALHGGFGIGGLLGEKYTLIISVVMPLLLW